MIRYADIIGDSIVDGPGLRVVAFLQGCPRNCAGCHNPALCPEEGGSLISEKSFAELLLNKLTSLNSGITFSGGDPLMQAGSLYDVIGYIRLQKPGLSIWVYTGYVFEEVKDLPVMKLIDVLVDGPFIAAEKSLNHAFRGSSNQRLINVKQSLENGGVVELAF
ncbi:anaerobic ribonucleoside-triphosphate reductase activating protein [Desulfofarcimen acetoxidans DSM 771]|uniref:Anaerobic ribonucleoside-triphosphate reductase-activating protein n=1 Tax=Desulfofarcimen acetoxidans (strain ATCC 49208 / DSM 771 / KCTC 5769 / VKM B-1644 / 5575) TaxID=485916 RepID=C8W490_DESAS|nr:anaerobic ribonucleoside-triphosphate reductase activating protein [Desulfofarcimen acetoxidans]ACV61958.1 anaerobic ribonucleoside-triphosphate reductase activating protein [Desulfofarcimen acetoxidans DSM 771]